MAKVNTGKMLRSELILKFRKICVMRGSLAFSNISYWEDIPVLSGGYLFTNVGQSTIIIDNCSFAKWYTTLFYGGEPVVLSIRNSLLNSDSCQKGMIVSNTNVGNCNCPTCISSFIFENNIILGDKSQTLQSFLSYVGFGPFTIRNNTFLNFQMKVQQIDPINYYFTRLICVTNAQDSIFIVDNNRFIGSGEAQGELSFYASAKAPAGGNSLPLNMIFRNNSFVNISTAKSILAVTFAQASSLIVDSNYFENVTVTSSNLNYGVLTAPLGSIIMTNNRFNKTQIDQGFYFQAFNTSVTNNTFSQIWSGKDQKAQAVLNFFSNQNLIVSAQFISNCMFVNTNFIYIKSTQLFAIDGINFINSSIIDRDYMMFDNNVNGSIANVYAYNISAYPTTFALATFNLITSGSISQLTNLTLLNSSVPLLNFNQILVQNTKPVLFSLQNLTITGCQLTSANGFFNFGSFTFPLFTFKLTLLSITEVKVQNSVLRSNMIGTITIDQASVQRIEGILVYLSPFSAQSGIPYCVLSLTNSQILNNNALENSLLITQTNSRINVINSTFSHNFGLGRGSVGFADKRKSEISSFNCTFENNYAVNGGVFYSQMDSQITIDNSTLRNNFAMYGGVAYINDDGVINAQNSLFINNSALVGNVFYLINSLDMSYFSGLSFETNKFIYSNGRQNFVTELLSLPLSLDISSLFDDSFLQKMKLNNQLVLMKSQEDILAYIQKFQLTVSGLNNFKKEERFIKSSAGSTIILNNTFIRDTQLLYILESSFSVITVANVSFPNITFSDQATGTWLLDIQVGCQLTFIDSTIHDLSTPLLKIFQSTINLYNISFTDIAIYQFGRPFIEVEQVSGNISMNLAFYNSDYENFMELLNSQIQSDNTTIQNIQTRYIQCSQSSIKIRNCHFSNNQNPVAARKLTAPSEGGLFINALQSSIEISNSSFENNLASNYYGGVVFNKGSLLSSMKTPLKMNSSTFFNNSGDSGAALYSSDSNIQISGCNFSENYASEKGGAIAAFCSGNNLLLCQSSFDGSIFASNIAQTQGGAINYDFLTPKMTNLTFRENYSPYGSNLASYSSELIIMTFPSTFSSGEYLDSGEFVLSLIDQQGLLVLSANSEKLTIYSLNTSFSILGPISFFSSKGMYDVSSIAFKGMPGTNGTYYLHSEGINTEKYLKVFGKDYQDLAINVNFRDCVVGEILKDFQCLKCMQGFYSLVQGAYSCQLCVNNAICPGGSTISLDQGIWRANTSTDSLHLCVINSACLGGVNSTCAEGYTGILCHECVGQSPNGNYYARSGENKCGKCTSIYLEYLKLLAVIVFLLIYVFIMVAMIIRNPSRKKDSSVLLRILTNYFQILTMISNLNLDWPQKILDFLNNFTFMSSATSNFFNVGCLLQTELTQKLNYFAIESIILACLPFLFIIFSIMMWKSLSVIRAKTFKANHIRNTYLTIFVFIFLVYPAITKNCFQMFTCVDIDGISRLSRDLNVQCWSDDHKFMLTAIALPIALIWILGFPLMIFTILFRNRNKLDDQDFLIKYGLFYIGLNDKQYYWEVVVINLRKVVFTGISVAMTKAYRYKLVLVCVILLITNQTMAKYLEPYNNASLNRIEQNSIYVCVLSMLMGMFFLHTSNSSEQDTLIGIFVVLIIINSGFLLDWSILMLKQIFISLKKVLAPIQKFTKQLTQKKQKLAVEVITESLEDDPEVQVEEIKKELNEESKLQLEQQQIIEERKKHDPQAKKKKKKQNRKLPDDVGPETKPNKKQKNAKKAQMEEGKVENDDSKDQDQGNECETGGDIHKQKASIAYQQKQVNKSLKFKARNQKVRKELIELKSKGVVDW